MDKFTEMIGFKKESIIAFILSVGITSVAMLDRMYFQNWMLVILYAFLGIIITGFITWVIFKAGFTVVRTLFLLSAEISLLIFLAQAYCGVTPAAAQSDKALVSLMTIGITYIGYEFFKKLIEALRGRLVNMPKKLAPWKKTLVIIFFVFFTFSFAYSLYQVVYPIISNLCVYKR